MTPATLAGQVALPRVLTGRVTAVAGVAQQPGRPTAYFVMWFDGLRRERPAGPIFAKPADAARLAAFLNTGSAPTSRSPHHVPELPATTGSGRLAGGDFEAPVADPSASARTCVRCGGPLPPGRPQRRTCSPVCRELASRARRAEKAAARPS